MCGILGTVGPRTFDATAFGRALDVMQARGPDDRGIYEEPETLLGHRRLAILDLSASGHQPMSTPDLRYTIVFNGEVYNYRELRKPLEDSGVAFRSHSDTEVILALYARKGPCCLESLRGMFALAIWDAQEKTLFLARDRMGIKPMYLWRNGKQLSFASEVKALRGLPGGPTEPEPRAIAAYLAWGSVPEPRTMLAGVTALSPGTWALWRDGVLKTESFWSIPTEPPTIHRRAEALELLRPLLKEAVALRCISDAPLGAFLSGGVDSSAVVALMRAAGQRDLRTYSISFPQTAWDESPYARAVADEFRTVHSDLPVTEPMVRNELPGFFAAMDQPTCDGFNTYLVSKFARQGGLSVSLSGLGGDELFAGYSTFSRIQRATPWLASLPKLASWGAGRVSRFGGRAVKLEALSLDNSVDARLYYASRGLFMPSQVRKLVHPDLAAAIPQTWSPLAPYGEGDPQDIGQPSRYNAPDVLHGTIFRELRLYMLNQLLRDTDVFGMAHSLEIRVPLLDHRLVEALFQIGPTVILGGSPKALLLEALPAPLPHFCTHRPKMGFTFPFDSWMRGPWRSSCEEALNNGAGGPLTPAAAARVWAGFLAGRVHWARPWSLLCLTSGWASRLAEGGRPLEGRYP